MGSAANTAANIISTVFPVATLAQAPALAAEGFARGRKSIVGKAGASFERQVDPFGTAARREAGRAADRQAEAAGKLESEARARSEDEASKAAIFSMQQAARARQRGRAGQSFRDTILTGPLGLTGGQGGNSGKTLLGL